MKKFRKGLMERCVSVLLSAAMMFTSMPSVVNAQEGNADGIVRVEENTMTEEILDSDVFYMASSVIRLEEGAGARYYVRIGRGGDCVSAASVNVKIADLTAKYGEDYEISLLGSKEKVENPENNKSLLERMEGEDYTETPMIDSEEASEKFSEDEELQNGAVESLNETVAYIEEAAGLSGETAAETADGSETVSTNPLQQARAAYTGIDGEPQNVTASQDTYQQIQQIADVLTTAVVGANLRVDFDEGVSSRYLVIDVKDNDEGDGNRYFYLMLSSPEGSTTISSASSCAGTIVDDEEQAASEVSFGDYSINEEKDTLTVEINRTGAINTIADVQLTTEELTAKTGRDFSPVDMSVTFPMGIDKRTIDIPICMDYVTKDAEFNLKLSSNYGADVKTAEKKIILQYEKKAETASSSVQVVSEARNLATRKYGDAINVLSPSSWSSDDRQHGSNNACGSAWRLEWIGGNGWDRFWCNYLGSAGAEWMLSSLNAFEYAGARVKWARNGSCANISVGFEGKWGYNNSSARSLAHYVEYTSTRGWSGDEERDIFSAITDPVYINIINRGNCDDCNIMDVKQIKPIYRPFLITLEESDKMTFLQEDGSYQADDGTATFLALDGAANNTNNQVVLFANETLTVRQTIGKNISTPYTYLTKLMTPDGFTFATFGNDGYTSHSKRLTAEYINDNSAYDNSNMFKYYDNSHYYNDYGTSGKYGKYGSLTLKPSFEYKTAKIKVNVPADKYGYFNISSTDKDIAESTTLEYHMGDKIQLSTKMYDKYSGLYKPAGYKVSYKYNESDVNWVKKDVIVPYDKNGFSYLDENERLRYGYYEITPLFQLKNNAIVVRVPASSVYKFDDSYGIFNTPYVSTEEAAGVTYRQYVVYNDPDAGRIYSISARVKEWNTYDVKIDWRKLLFDYTNMVQVTTEKHTGGCIWKLPGSDTEYSGDVFYVEASGNARDNIITLDYNSMNAKDMPYHEVSGSVYMPSYNMLTRQAGYTNMLPAKNALVTFGGSFGTVDESGNFKIPAFRAISGKNIRYLVSLNGETVIKETKLNESSAGSIQQITYTVDSDVRTEDVLLVNNNVGQQLISVENGSIINNVQVWAEGSNYSGFSLVADPSNPITMKARCLSPVNYTRTTIDSNGTVREESAQEHLTGIEFVIYDSYANKELKAYTAQYDSASGTYSAALDMSTLMPGNRLYMRVKTDKATSKYVRYDEQGNLINTVNDADLNSTTYSDVYTGYSFSQKTTEDMPLPEQQVSPLDNMDFSSLPLLGSTGMNFDFPFVSVAVEKTDTGYRMSIGFSPLQIADTVRSTHLTKFAGAGGTYYKDMFSIAHPFKTFASGIKESFSHIAALKDMGKKGLDAAKKAAGALGAPTWKFDMQLGVYIEFTYMELTNSTTGYKYTEAVFTGVGGYIGVSGGFQMTWYTILPVVFLPAYFGIEIDASLLGYFGAATDTSKPKVTYNDATKATVDFNNYLSKFNVSVRMSAGVQVYVGVGLAGVLGLRGGGSVEVMGQYEPSDVVSDWGCMITFKAGIWIDLFLFSIPLQYTFPELKYGSFKEYADASQKIQAAAMESAGFTLREAYSDRDSVWMPPESSVQSAFSESSSYTLVSDGYEHPDVQLLKLSDGSIFMAFLDTDSSRTDLERAVLKYSVYKDGSWSEPVVVQNDGTADFQPSICEMDNGEVMISWLSTDPADEKSGEAEDYLSSMEVYTAVVDYDAENPVSEITRLTTDEYYDYLPISVYDDVTGDRAVYFVKTASTGTAQEMANSYTNDCVVTYMLYSDPENSGQGRWLFDYYYDDEVASEEDKQELLNNWKGQRFLSSPIPKLGLDVPNIADFTATAYNGLAVFAYTIDQDSSNDTTYDKELFVQLYDFETHKTYVPVRITEDNVSDAVPQLVRVGSGENAVTKLFWYRNERDVAYLDLTDLIRYGVDDNGQIKDDYLTKDGETSLERLYSYVATKSEGSQGYRSMADYKAVVDGDNVYVVWTQAADRTVDANASSEEESEDTLCREVYAAALIQPEEECGDDAEGSIGCAWSNPFRLTYTNAYTDEPTAAIDADGNMMVVYNQYDQEITEDGENPVVISDFKMRASYMEPSGAVEVESIDLSDRTPEAGEVVTADVVVVNNGLTCAKGYTVSVYAASGDQEVLIDTIDSDETLVPGQSVHYPVEWTAPASVAGCKLRTESYEKGGAWTNRSYAESEELLWRAEYDVSDVTIWQDQDAFYAEYDITNIGNAVSTDKDYYEVMLTGPYYDTFDCTTQESVFADVSLEGIEVNETKHYSTKLDIPAKVFEKYGYVTCLGIVKDEKENYRTEGEDIRIDVNNPMELRLNGAEIPSSITMKKGESLELQLSCSPQKLNAELSAAFGADDSGIVQVSGTTLTAQTAGTTVLHGSVMPYGNTLPDITVTVLEDSETLPSTQPVVSAEPEKSGDPDVIATVEPGRQTAAPDVSNGQKPDASKSGNNSTPVKAPRTGDDSPAMLWVLMFMAAGTGAVCVRRRRKQIQKQ